MGLQRALPLLAAASAAAGQQQSRWDHAVAGFSFPRTVYPGYVDAVAAANGTTYPYTEPVAAEGEVVIRSSPNGVELTGGLVNMENSVTGGIHVHQGRTCPDSAGHYIPPGAVDDPWSATTYTTDGAGKAELRTSAPGVRLDDVVGRAVVIHDSAGNRIACIAAEGQERLAAGGSSSGCSSVAMGILALLVAFSALPWAVWALRGTVQANGDDGPQYLRERILAPPLLHVLFPRIWLARPVHIAHWVVEVFTRGFAHVYFGSASGGGVFLYLFVAAVVRALALRCFAAKVAVRAKPRPWTLAPDCMRPCLGLLEEWLLRLLGGLAGQASPTAFLSLFPTVYPQKQTGVAGVLNRVETMAKKHAVPAGEAVAKELLHPALLGCEYIIVLAASLSACSDLTWAFAVLLIFAIIAVIFHSLLGLALHRRTNPPKAPTPGSCPVVQTPALHPAYLEPPEDEQTSRGLPPGVQERTAAAQQAAATAQLQAQQQAQLYQQQAGQYSQQAAAQAQMYQQQAGQYAQQGQQYSQQAVAQAQMYQQQAAAQTMQYQQQMAAQAQLQQQQAAAAGAVAATELRSAGAVMLQSMQKPTGFRPGGAAPAVSEESAGASGAPPATQPAAGAAVTNEGNGTEDVAG